MGCSPGLWRLRLPPRRIDAGRQGVISVYCVGDWLGTWVFALLGGWAGEWVQPTGGQGYRRLPLQLSSVHR